MHDLCARQHERVDGMPVQLVAQLQWAAGCRSSSVAQLQGAAGCRHSWRLSSRWHSTHFKGDDPLK